MSVYHSTLEKCTGRSSADELKKIRLTDRDYQVLNFIWEMKFGYAPILKRLFFSSTLDGKPRISDHFVRNRLADLKSAGFITSVLRPNSREYLYVLTRLGEQQVCQYLNIPCPQRSINDFDPRIFDHDMKVMLSRLALEKSGRAKKWIAERQIKQTLIAFQGLARKYIPDGLYQNGLGELVAFEMEISPKSRSRYQEKIDKYIVLFKSHFSTPIRFSRALFVCEHNSVYLTLCEMTRIHGDRFRVVRFHEFISILESVKDTVVSEALQVNPDSISAVK